MVVDLTELNRKYANYPNIRFYIEMLVRNGAHARLEWVEKQAPTELAKIGFTIDDVEEMLGYMLNTTTNERRSP